MSSDKFVDLKPDRSLLDPKFDGYKLSLDKLPVYSTDITSGVDVTQLTDAQYSYQHVKAFGATNQLHLDPWSQEHVYVINQKWEVERIQLSGEGKPGPATTVYQIPDSSYHRTVPGRINVSVQFPAPEVVVMGDGTGRLLILDTGDRKEGSTWQTSYCDEVLGKDRVFSVLHSTRHSDNENHHVDILLLSVDKHEQEEEAENSSIFVTTLEWLTFSAARNQSAAQSNWQLVRSRRLEGASSPDYAAVDVDGSAVFVASQKPYKFVYDSVSPVEEEEVSSETNTEKAPAYTWYQTPEEVEVQFTLPPHATKSDVLYKLTPTHVELGLKNGPVLLQGALAGSVDVDASTWCIVDLNRLDLQLCKSPEVSWETVVEGDERGEMMVDAETVAAVHQRLANTTSDNMNADPQEGAQAPYNTQQLEECDSFPEDSATMARWDGETHKPTHQVNLGSHQLLFTSQIEASKLPAICLRHDVDGLIWQPTEVKGEGHDPWEHVATFNALGYVQASKQQRKYATCARDFSFAALCDNVRHVYVYRQPSAISSPIRNRKTGQQVAAVAKQQLVTLDSVDTVVGMAATRDCILLLAGGTLYTVKVTSE